MSPLASCRRQGGEKQAQFPQAAWLPKNSWGKGGLGKGKPQSFLTVNVVTTPKTQASLSPLLPPLPGRYSPIALQAVGVDLGTCLLASRQETR